MWILLQRGASVIVKWDSFFVLQRGASGITKLGKYYKVEQLLLQSGSIIIKKCSTEGK